VCDEAFWGKSEEQRWRAGVESRNEKRKSEEVVNMD
jgi:hypothetical protein